MKEFRLRRAGTMRGRKIRLPDPFGRIKHLQTTCRGYIHENQIVVPTACAKPSYRDNYDAELLEAVSWAGVTQEIPENTEVKKQSLLFYAESAAGKYLLFVPIEEGKTLSGK